MYKDMTPEQRRAAHDDQAEAVRVHGDCFAVRPSRGGRYDRMAERHMARCNREAAFIRRVARSCGDAWAA